MSKKESKMPGLEKKPSMNQSKLDSTKSIAEKVETKKVNPPTNPISTASKTTANKPAASNASKPETTKPAVKTTAPVVAQKSSTTTTKPIPTTASKTLNSATKNPPGVKPAQSGGTTAREKAKSGTTPPPAKGKTAANSASGAKGEKPASQIIQEETVSEFSTRNTEGQ